MEGFYLFITGLMMINRREMDVTVNARRQELSFSNLQNVQNIENALVVQSMNYHGQQLTNFLKDLPEFRNLDLQNVDYNLYKLRSKELRTEDRGRRMLIHEFILRNFNSLFKHSEPRFISIFFFSRLKNCDDLFLISEIHHPLIYSKEQNICWKKILPSFLL